MIDIYTKKPIVAPSDEHILLNALGGRKSAPLVDKSTNDTLGATVDASLARSLELIRVCLNAKSGDGEPPPAVRGMTSDEGEAFNLLPGRFAETADTRLQFEATSTGLRITGPMPRTRGQLRRQAKRTFAKYGLPLSALDGVQTTRRKPAPLNKNFEFGTDTWRAIAKMVCNLLALMDRELFLGVEFDPIRKFILEGGDPWSFVAVNTTSVEMSTEALGPLDHLLAVRCSPDGGVEAFVALYSYLQFTVRLSSAAFDRAVTTAYRVDQIGGRHRLDDVGDLAIPIPGFVPLVDAGQASWFDAFEMAMRQVMSFATRDA